MIHKKTVFIIGAGASVPFGYPTGDSLVKQILKEGRNKETIRACENMGFRATELSGFLTDLKKSVSPSIDSFLEFRNEYIDIGKFLITKILIKYEDENRIFDNPDWYKYLFNKLSGKFEEFGDNKVTFITFNYDRSLDHFLFSALKHKYNKSNVETVRALRKLPIIHVHGQIGDLPWQNGNSSRTYSDKATPREIFESSKGIKIIHEKNPDASIFTKINNILLDAYRIYFLGFGYHKTNLIRLQISELVQRSPHSLSAAFEIKGSDYHMAEKEIESVKQMTNGNIKFSDNPNSTLWETLSFLRNVVSFD